jgi:hypothetical protein
MAQPTKSQLYRLLYAALLDLRVEGHTADHPVVLLLADLFHTVPLQLDRVDQGALTPGEILDWLHARAQGTPMEAWLNLREQEVMRGEPDDQGAPPDDRKGE